MPRAGIGREFGRWGNMKQQKEKWGRQTRERGSEEELAKGTSVWNMASNVFCWKSASLHCIADGVVKSSTSLTLEMFPEVNLSGTLNSLMCAQ